MRAPFLAAFALALIAGAIGDSAAAATLMVGPGAPLERIADAARLARDGDIVEILLGDYVGDVAVWTQKNLTIRGLGVGPTLAANGQIAEGKAIWVFRDGDFLVENIRFAGARAADHNGAGIRFERGRMRVVRCRFSDNENGIITANDADSELAIEDSEFSAAPIDRGPLMHLLYVGRIARFTLSGTHVSRGFDGHLVKSRARENYIYYNLLYDRPGARPRMSSNFPTAASLT